MSDFASVRIKALPKCDYCIKVGFVRNGCLICDRANLVAEAKALETMAADLRSRAAAIRASVKTQPTTTPPQD